MTIKVYNTLTRTKEPFETIEPGKVGMYLCGPTVYKPAHIGHMVGPVIFDTVKRYLTYSGYDVTYIINITDIDDKLINRAAEKGVTVEALAKEMTDDYFENLTTMGVDTVDKFPYATEHIQEMLDIIQKLVDDGYAYPLDGDVYFETTKDDDYGALSGRKLDEIMSGTRVEATDKKHHPADFALWKKSKPGEPAWDSPWGAGRPGWHIECSAMSMKYIGETLDIHGGGLDLMFPHHENELAQSECCTGKPFSTYWMHNGLMQASGEAGKVGGDHDRSGDLNTAKEAQEAGKLAGSKGADSVKLMFEKFDPETVRFFLLATHYRSPIDFSEERMAEIEKSIEGFYRLFETFDRISGNSFYELKTAATRRESVSLEEAESELLKEIGLFRSRFWEAMDDDFNTGGGVGILHEMRKSINAYISDHQLGDGSEDTKSVITLTTAVSILKELSNLLGVFRKPLAKTSGADDEFVNGLMNLIIDLRAEARDTKNWGIADRIRDGLKELKVVLEDRTGDTLWRRE